jgi:hypothetical protein
MEFAERAQIPRHQIAHRDVRGDGRRHRCADPAVADRRGGRRAGEQVA